MGLSTGLRDSSLTGLVPVTYAPNPYVPSAVLGFCFVVSRLLMVRSMGSHFKFRQFFTGIPLDRCILAVKGSTGLAVHS